MPTPTHTTVDLATTSAATRTSSAASRASAPSSVDYGAALLRLALGAVMLAHAGAKYFIYTLPGTAAYFSQHGFPAWTALPVFLLEAVGGLLLLVGWKVRWVALALVPVLLGAWHAHAANGWMFTAPHGGWEYPAFLVFALLAQALLGAGAWSLTRQIRPQTSSAPSTRASL